MAFEFEADETIVRGRTPLKELRDFPLEHLVGRLLIAEVELANKSKRWALLSNVDSDYKSLNDLFLSISFQEEDCWFHLARYFDPDFTWRGPTHLAEFLRLKVMDIFPIKFDISGLAIGKRQALKGNIPLTPRKKLSRKEVLALAVPKITPEIAAGLKAYGYKF